jgi:hypothetical protein
LAAARERLYTGAPCLLPLDGTFIRMLAGAHADTDAAGDID